MKYPEVIKLTHEQVKDLIERIKGCDLPEADRDIVSKVLQMFIWLEVAISEAQISMYRLAKLLGFKSEKKKYLEKLKKAKGTEESEAPDPTEELSEPESPEELRGAESPEETQEREDIEPLNSNKTDQINGMKKRKGHGRRKHTVYSGAETVYVAHRRLKVGDPCPFKCSGWLYRIDPGVVIQLTGNPVITGKRFVQEKLRCSACGAVFCARLPEGINRKKRYDHRARSVLVLQRYYLGSPAYRIEKYQELMGIPLADATQWDLCEKVADCLYPIYNKLVELAAQGEIIHNDDTAVRILSLMKENRENPGLKRKGMHTTGIVAFTGSHRIVLFFSGRRHAGENLDQILKHRAKHLGKIIQMADALSSSKSKEFETILCNCLTHGRRKFADIYRFFMKKCEHVINELKKVYEVDEIAKAQKMTPEERLALHQKESKPVMDALKKWMEEEVSAKRVEPNSSLGKAYQYMFNHWPELTRFLEVAGAPLDNNVVEQALKIPIRHRKNSLFYKTENGALIGDIHMSIVHTCANAKKNPFDYLNALQTYRSLARRNPLDWLPWNYEETMKKLAPESLERENRSPPRPMNEAEILNID
jgi:transposase